MNKATQAVEVPVEADIEITRLANLAVVEIATIKANASDEIESKAIALFLYIGERMTNGLSAKVVSNSLVEIKGDYGFTATKVQFAPVGYALKQKDTDYAWTLADLLSKSERLYRSTTQAIKDMPKVEGESKPNTTEMAVKAISKVKDIETLVKALPKVVARNRAPKGSTESIGEILVALNKAIESHTDLTVDAKYYPAIAKALTSLAVLGRANGIGIKKSA